MYFIPFGGAVPFLIAYWPLPPVGVRIGVDKVPSLEEIFIETIEAPLGLLSRKYNARAWFGRVVAAVTAVLRAAMATAIEAGCIMNAVRSICPK